MKATARTMNPVFPSSHARRHVQNITIDDSRIPAAASVSYGAMLIGIQGRLGGVSGGGSHSDVLTLIACGSIRRIHSTGIGVIWATTASIPAINVRLSARVRGSLTMSGFATNASPARTTAAGIHTHV